MPEPVKIEGNLHWEQPGLASGIWTAQGLWMTTHSLDAPVLYVRVYMQTDGYDTLTWWIEEYVDGDSTYWTGIEEPEGLASIELTVNGADMDWSVVIAGVEHQTGSFVGGASETWFPGIAHDANNTPTEKEARNLGTVITFDDASTRSFDWATESQINGWTRDYGYPFYWETGFLAEAYPGLSLGIGGWYSYPGITPDITAAGSVSACLQSPGITRRVMSDANGQLYEEFNANGGWSAVLTSANTDAAPEVMYLGATGAQLGLVWQRDTNIVATTSDGRVAAGWGPVQTVRAGRDYPTACVIKPSHDVYCIAYQSDGIAKGQRLAWDGTDWTVGAEVTVKSSGVNDERGHVRQLPDGRLVYVYTNTNEDIVSVQSTDAGATWA